MIKKYEQFILEKVKQTEFDTWFQRIDSHQKVDQFTPELKNEKSYMDRMRKDFASKINGLSEYFESYFSNLASSNGNPEEDFEEMQRIIDKTGFTLDVIKKLFNKKVCQLTSEYFSYFIHQNRLDIINGYIDVYLYMINEKLEISKMTGVEHQIDLGGQGFDKSMDSQEWIIKYAYGYHKTPYGQLFIKQLGLTPDQFVEYTFMNIKEYFDDQMRSNFAYELTKIKKPYDFDKGDIDDFDWSKFIQVDDDGFIVYYNEMENDIIENHGDFGGFITEDLLKKVIMECFRDIKDVIKIHDSGDYFHFHE
jgi:hypothetical protein